MTLTLKNTLKKRLASLPLSALNPEELLENEWLLTNSRGSFSCSTIAACNTRRYHSLLTGSLTPPANRTLALSNLRETITFDKNEIELGNFEFENKLAAEGLNYVANFTKDIGAHFDYTVEDVQFTKSIYLLPDADIVAVVYDFETMTKEFDFSVRPLAAMRDFHSLQTSQANLTASEKNGKIIITNQSRPSAQLAMTTNLMTFHHDSQWWYNFLYRKEAQRQQDHIEDLWSPGFFKCRIDSPTRIILWAGFGGPETSDDITDLDIDIVIDSLKLRQKELTENINDNDNILTTLYTAAAQFVVERQINNKPTTTILAGFPWFLDWGRDAFIALPGLLLSTARLTEAADVLTTFASAVNDGMIPNRFDDYGNEPHYNSIDASLWFVHAAFEYLYSGGSSQLFSVKLLPALRWITDSYRHGTRFGIHADDDNLITGGNAKTQLTWMDAKFDDISFTPRYGKAVEINALWYNALCSLAQYYKDRKPETSTFYTDLAKRVSESFINLFWNEEKGHLNDCILPDGTIDNSLRPNQIFAVSLPFSPLSSGKQKKVVEAVQNNLLTPFGLRTLSPQNPQYHSKYEGNQKQRDNAYHNGTVWPFLIGPFIEAYLKVNNFSKQSKRKATRYLRPLLNHLNETGCIAGISEIFDADEPQKPKGCFTQAWSIAEVLRAYLLIDN